jgi:hypothetical protein
MLNFGAPWGAAERLSADRAEFDGACGARSTLRRPPDLNESEELS